MASWAGNLMMKHSNRDFLSDILALFECIGAKVTVCKYGWFESGSKSASIKPTVIVTLMHDVISQ